jgi:hypothetical protein
VDNSNPLRRVQPSFPVSPSGCPGYRIPARYEIHAKTLLFTSSSPLEKATATSTLVQWSKQLAPNQHAGGTTGAACGIAVI